MLSLSQRFSSKIKYSYHNESISTIPRDERVRPGHVRDEPVPLPDFLRLSDQHSASSLWVAGSTRLFGGHLAHLAVLFARKGERVLVLRTLYVAPLENQIRGKRKTLIRVWGIGRVPYASPFEKQITYKYGTTLLSLLPC